MCANNGMNSTTTRNYYVNVQYFKVIYSIQSIKSSKQMDCRWGKRGGELEVWTVEGVNQRRIDVCAASASGKDW